MEIAELKERAGHLRTQIESVVVGQSRAIDLMLLALIAEGHVLLEGMPGTAKTLLAHTFAAGLSLRFRRVQFTPDLMPGDITGTNLFDFQQNEFRLTQGPIFTDVLLADEINRTPPKTQAALLQAMQEREVTIDGVDHALGEGFMVIATQNPIEHEGTYPLPEAQLDRFLVKIPVGYPARDEELRMVALHGHRTSSPRMEELGLERLADLDWIRAARRAVAGVELAGEVAEYAVDLVRASRESPSLAVGASPRATNVLCLAARAHAALAGRDYVIPDDVQALLHPVLAHRVVLAPGAELEGLTPRSVLEQSVKQVPVPR